MDSKVLPFSVHYLEVTWIKLSVCFVQYHTLKAYGGVGVQLYSFLTS